MSQNDSQTKRIGGAEFTVFKLPYKIAAETFIDLLHVIGPSAGGIMRAVTGKWSAKKILDEDAEKVLPKILPDLADAIGNILPRITNDHLQKLIDTMLPVTHYKDKPLTGVDEVVFRGNMPLLFQWLAFAIKVQYGNFTEIFQTAIASGMVAMEDKSQDT